MYRVEAEKSLNSWFTAAFCFKSERLIQILFEFFCADIDHLFDSIFPCLFEPLAFEDFHVLLIGIHVCVAGLCPIIGVQQAEHVINERRDLGISQRIVPYDLLIVLFMLIAVQSITDIDVIPEDFACGRVVAFDENSQIFGARKIAAILQNKGVKVGDEMVRELMKDMGLVSIRQEAKKLYTDDMKRHKNYLNQEFDPDAPNQVWVSDITYFKCNGKSYYICVIIDLYARKVIAYKAGKKNSTQLIKTAFKQAYACRQPSPSLIFHTDRGANYCSKTLNDYIKSLGITRSFSRPYVPYDNSVIESFFASLKREELYRKKYRTEGELFQALNDYMDFYNTRRPHAKIQYKTPEQKEREYSAIFGNSDNE